MIALAITAALIIQTYDGQTRVVENLTDEGCAAAQCLSQFGQSCMAQRRQEEMEAARLRILQERQEKWDRDNPKAAAACTKGGVRMRGGPVCGPGEYITAWAGVSVPSSATKTAMCVK